MEDDLPKKMEDDLKKEGRRPQTKMEDDLKKNRRLSVGIQPINLIGCDTIVNSPSLFVIQ